MECPACNGDDGGRGDSRDNYWECTICGYGDGTRESAGSYDVAAGKARMRADAEKRRQEMAEYEARMRPFRQRARELANRGEEKIAFSIPTNRIEHLLADAAAASWGHHNAKKFFISFVESSHRDLGGSDWWKVNESRFYKWRDAQYQGQLCLFPLVFQKLVLPVWANELDPITITVKAIDLGVAQTRAASSCVLVEEYFHRLIKNYLLSNYTWAPSDEDYGSWAK